MLGEAGTGKTTLLRSVLEQLDENVKVATIINTDVTFGELLHMVLVDLGIADASEQLGKVAALQRLNELAIGQLRKRGNIVIMVDEAQNLDRHCMENLRLISNLETSKTKLLQIILSGQPELEDKLRRPDLRQLAQRINLRRYLLPMDEKETYAYIRHRLNAAHFKGPTLFTGGARRLIWEYSGGIPRMINTVCDNVLLTGYALKRRKMDKRMVREVIDDLTRNPFAERAKITPASTPKPEPQPEAKAPPAATIISEAQVLQRPFWSIQLREVIGDLYRTFFAERAKITPTSTPILLFVLLLMLLAGVGLVTWHFHWNENSAPAMPGNVPAATTEIGKNLVEAPASPPRPESTASEAAHPGAALETYRETSANMTPQPPPEPIQLETLPPPAGEPEPIQLETLPPPAGEPEPIQLETLPPPAGEPEPIQLETLPPPAGEPELIQLETLPPPAGEPELIQLETLPLPAGEEKIAEPTEITPLAVEAQEPPEAGPSPHETTIVVRDGESLYRIIIRHFGKYDKALRQKILLVNPGIKNPNLIYPDQIITIPNVPPVSKR